MGDKGTVTLICCGNCAHDFGREYRKILKEFRKTGCEIVSMLELDPKPRSQYFLTKARGYSYSTTPRCSVCGYDQVSRHRIKWRQNV